MSLNSMLLLLISLLSIFNELTAYRFARRNCVTYLANKDIDGRDLTSRVGHFGECCGFCRETANCKAFAWKEGTCWLKSEVWPLKNYSGEAYDKVAVGVLNIYPDSRCEIQYINKDIVGSDIKNITSGDPTLCCGYCIETPLCVAYSWSDYNGGTCWLKSNFGPIVEKSQVQMGIAIKSVTKECKSRFFNKDIPGYDLDEKRGQFADCCIFCQETPGCKAYAWSDYRGGTCWMKSTITEMVEKQGVQVGILDLDTTQQCKSQYLNKDIKGNDIKGIKGQFDECCYFCLKTNGCKAYSWVNEDGGTCWLKSVNGPLIEWGGIRVGVIEEPAKKKSKIEDQQIVPNQNPQDIIPQDKTQKNIDVGVKTIDNQVIYKYCNIKNV
jgi:hypothetical protein